MRVFITGATGWIGSAVVKNLIAAGHQVLGLTRSENGAKALTEAGAEAHHGSLDDLGSLKSGAAKSDGVIHLAFNHDFARFAQSCEEDKQVIETIGAALEGSDRPFIITGGVGRKPTGGTVTEADPPGPILPVFPRASEHAAIALAERGVRATVVRLPRSVHGRGEQHGFVPSLIARARATGVSAYVGDGLNLWPAVHRLDAATLYRLVLERGAEGGPFHAVADEGVTLKEIAAVIGRHLNVPVVSKSPEEAAEHFGRFAMLAGGNWPASSDRTRSLLGWQPEQLGLIDDIDHPDYFA